MSLTNEGAHLTSWAALACSGVQPLASQSGGLMGHILHAPGVLS